MPSDTTRDFRSPAQFGGRADALGCRLDVGNLSIFVFEEQWRALRVFDDFRPVRKTINNLAVLKRFHERGKLSFPLRPARTRVRSRHFALRNSHNTLAFVENLGNLRMTPDCRDHRDTTPTENR